MNNDVKFEKSEKRILRLIALFAVIILVSQVMQFINSRNNDNEYRKMLVSRMIIVENSQKIMVETTYIHRLLLNLLIKSSPAEVETFKDISSESFNSIQRETETIEKTVFTTGQSDKKSEILLNTKEYEKACRQFLVLLETDKVKALEFKNVEVRPAFEKCQQVQTDLINVLNNDLQAESDKIATASIYYSVLILLLGISPFLLLVIYLVFQSSRILYNEFS